MLMQLQQPEHHQVHHTTCTSGMSVKNPKHDNNKSQVLEYTLFLFRHGEASHNVLEKLAKQQALMEAVSQGLDEQETKARMEKAREDVLLDDTLFDAPLSAGGIEQARKASVGIESIYSKYNLKPPERVLVSPLTRTLETASILFPENDNIHVREDLRERCTGKPPDVRSPAHKLKKRQSFSRFSMNDLSKLAEMAADSGDSDLEDKATLRERTQKLFKLLAKFPPQNIAVVTHKGYLRELERGPFGKPLATEFDNCELRVYQIRFHVDDNSLELAHRIV